MGRKRSQRHGLILRSGCCVSGRGWTGARAFGPTGHAADSVAGNQEFGKPEFRDWIPGLSPVQSPPQYAPPAANGVHAHAAHAGVNRATPETRPGFQFPFRILGQHTEAVQKCYTAHLNPYLNNHRPCGFAMASPDVRGKHERRYLSGQRLSDAYEKTEEGRAVLETGAEPGYIGPVGQAHQRYRMHAENGSSQRAAHAPMQTEIAVLT